MKYRGSCHCGKVAYEVDGVIENVIACNCSICQRKGSLLWFVPRASFNLLTPPENSRAYEFNKHAIQHRFCTVCGIHPYAEGVDRKGNRMAAINVRCLENLDPDTLPVTHFDGRSL